MNPAKLPNTKKDTDNKEYENKLIKAAHYWY
jgi:hypothetical protein